MKKHLLVLALPILLLSACNDAPKKKEAVSYAEFQEMTERSITEGLLVNATFQVTFSLYDVDLSGQMTLDEASSQTINFIVDHAKMYVGLPYSESEFVCDFENDKLYRKNDKGEYELMSGIGPNNLDAYTKYGSAVRKMQYDIIGEKKNGKYSSTDNLITYQMKDESKTTYGVMYSKGKDGEYYFNNYTRAYYYSSEIYHYYFVNIQSYSGTIPSVA